MHEHANGCTYFGYPNQTLKYFVEKRFSQAKHVS